MGRSNSSSFHKRPTGSFDGLELEHPANVGLVEEFSAAPNRFGGPVMFGLKSDIPGTLVGFGAGYGWQPTSRPDGYGQINIQNGSSYVSAANNPGFQPTAAVGIFAWTNQFTASSYAPILNMQALGSWSNPYAYWHMRFETQDLTGWSISYVNELRASNVIVNNTWQFVGYTYDGANQRLWCNGKNVATSTLTGAIPTSTQPLRIGNDTSGDYFPGAIGSCFVFNSAMTAEQVASLYQETLTGNPNRWRWISPTTWFLPTGGVSPVVTYRETRSLLGTRTGSRQAGGC